jgi:hypothetical protein
MPTHANMGVVGLGGGGGGEGRDGRKAQSTERVHIRARALLDINLIRFGYISRLSQWGGGGYYTLSNYFYLPSLRLGGGVITLGEGRVL